MSAIDACLVAGIGGFQLGMHVADLKWAFAPSVTEDLEKLV